jgi:Na+/proline symporter
MASELKLTFLPYVAGYILVIIALALVFSRKVKKSDDFSVAGRKLGPIIVAGTLLATWMGGGTILSNAQFIYQFGPYAGAIRSFMEPISIVMLVFLVKIIRVKGAYTVSGILGKTYGSFGNILSALAIIFSYVLIVSYQINGFGKIINYSTGIEKDMAILISFIVVVVITVVGGMISIAYTDAMSAFLITFGLYTAIPVLLMDLGGFKGMASSLPPELMTFSGTLSPLQLTGYILPTLFLVLGDQNMYQRLLSAKDTSSALRGACFWVIGTLLINIPILILVTCARSMELIPLGLGNEEAYSYSLLALAGEQILPIFLGGIVLASASAFLLTTGDSYLLSSSTVFVYDLVEKYSKISFSEKQKLVLQRMMCIVLSLIVLLILFKFFTSALEMQVFAYTIYGATITPALLGALLWKGVTKEGGICSMVTGLSSSILIQILFNIYRVELEAVIISAPLAIVVLIVASCLTRK